MRLICKNGFIYLDKDNEVVTGTQPVCVEVDFPDLVIKDYLVLVTINDVAVNWNNGFTITNDHFKNKTIKLNICLAHNTTGFQTNFTSDKIPLTRAIILGKSYEEVYPTAMKAMAEDIKLLQNAVHQLNEKGEIL